MKKLLGFPVCFIGSGIVLLAIVTEVCGQTNCVPAPEGLVSWWKAEANAVDETSANNGTLIGDTGFGAGRGGQAFVLDGSGDGVSVGNPTNLQLQTFTIEGWIQRSSLSRASQDPWDSGSVFCYAWGGYVLGIHDDGRPFMGKVGYSEVSPSFAITDTNTFHHVGVTKTGGTVTFYLDGTAQTVTGYDPGFVFNGPAAIGARGGDFVGSFLGSIDEVGVYNRALSPAEMQSIYTAGTFGKCPLTHAPAIVSQPQSQTVLAGGTAAFNVTASGTQPLSYQWHFAGVELAGETGSSLILTNVAPNQAGLYAVIVTNLYGSATSSPAQLTVLVPGTNCNPSPSGLVSWWKAEGNVQDESGNNHGALVGNVAFGAGSVGQSFVFDGSGDGVSVGNPANLQLQTFTIEAWIKRSSLSAASQDPWDSGGIFDYAWGGYAFGVQDDGRLFLGKVGYSAVASTFSVRDTNNFHHVAVTKTGGNVVLYLDGVAETAATDYDPGFVFNGPAAIGTRGGDFVGSFLGSIDEVSIYNRALSLGEIQAIYTAGGFGKCPLTNPPSILSQPQNQTVAAEGTATFSVTASGTQPLGYQWRFEGVDLSGATGASLVLTNVATNQAGLYSVVVTNPYGSVTSSPANLMVRVLGTNLFDDFEPNIDLFEWSSFGGTVVATNYGGWVSSSNSLWFGGTGSRFAVTRPLNTVSGALVDFYLRISDGTSSPWEKADLPGEGIVVEYSTNGGSNWTQMGRYDTSNYFTWAHIAMAIPARAQAPSTQFRWRQLSNSGNPSDHWALDDVRIQGGPVAPMIVSQPQNQSVIVGASASFSVTVSGTAPLSYQWRRDGTNVDGATASSLVLTNIQFADAGIYSVVISNSAGTTNSSDALLTVNAAPTCQPPVGDLVSWWPGNGDASDSVGTNHAIFAGGAFVTGKVGSAFRFDGSNYLRVSASASLNVGTQSGFTLEAWISPSNSTSMPIFEYAVNGAYGVHLWANSLSASRLYGAVIASDGSEHILQTTNVLTANVFQHIALSYDKASGVARIFHNGVIVQQLSVGTFTPRTSTDLYIGFRPASSPYGPIGFRGLIDEASVYSRALSPAEIQAIFSAGSSGKCTGPTPPAIVSQPASRTVLIGSSTMFSVTAIGTQPLSYQWQLDGTNIAGATTSSLVLNNIQFADAGSYSVTVSNSVGSITSSNAMLVVTLPPPCATPTPGLVGWWKGETNALDEVGVNNGSLAGNTGFGTGTAGTAFVLDGSGDGVVLSNMPSLRLQDFTIETWIKRGSSTVVSLNHPLYGVLLGYGLGGYGLGLRNDGRLYISKVGASDTGIDNAVTDTNWHHVAVTKLGTNVIFYVDGIAYPTLPYDPGFTFTTPIAIGAQGDTLASSFLGSIDEISVYNRNLSTSEIQAIYNAGSSGKCTTGIPPSISLQPADQNVTVGGTANFSIAASGTQPLAYQWLRNGTSLNGETGASLVLTNAQLSQAGSYSVLVSNVAGSILSSNASLVVSLPPALVRAVGGSITAGAEIILPVKLVANGNENALGFSLSFDASWLTYASASLGSAASSASLLLNTNQVGNGKLGIALALPTEAAFAAGTQDVIHVNFNTEILSGTQSVATAISFVDQPIVKRVVDAQAQALPANYANATVTLIPGDLEADVAARPTGDRVLDIVDWVEVGRFVAGLDVPATGSEFQRADCTPRPALGDGQLKVTDWVQAGRYAAGLDPLTLAGGPTNAAGPALRAQPMRPSEGEEGPAVREVRVSNGTAIHGLTVTVPVMLESLGDENAVGFTLTFDPSVFQYYSASKGSAAASGTLNVNPNVAGKVGVTVALPTSSTFAVGTREVARVTLTAIAPVASDYPIALGDQPVVRAVSDVRANELNATYTAGSVFVNPVPKLDIMRSGQSAVLSWPVWAEGFSVQSRDLLLSRNWTNVSGTVQTNVGNLTLTVPVTGEAKYFRLYHP